MVKIGSRVAGPQCRDVAQIFNDITCPGGSPFVFSQLYGFVFIGRTVIHSEISQAGEAGTALLPDISPIIGSNGCISRM